MTSGTEGHRNSRGHSSMDWGNWHMRHCHRFCAMDCVMWSYMWDIVVGDCLHERSLMVD